MKHLVMLLLAIAFANKLSAQDVTYWVGRSSHPDPIIRHHEAFMEAFAGYIQNSRSNQNSCRMETVSSVTNERVETLTIAIGNGILVNYEYIGSTIESEGTTYSEFLLTIVSEGDGEKSIHEYKRTIVDENNTNQNVKSNFAYCCNYDYVQK